MALKRVCEHDARARKVIKYLFIGLQKPIKSIIKLLRYMSDCVFVRTCLSSITQRRSDENEGASDPPRFCCI